jgi:hypothetical protein
MHRGAMYEGRDTHTHTHTPYHCCGAMKASTRVESRDMEDALSHSTPPRAALFPIFFSFLSTAREIVLCALLFVSSAGVVGRLEECVVWTPPAEHNPLLCLALILFSNLLSRCGTRGRPSLLLPHVSFFFTSFFVMKTIQTSLIAHVPPLSSLPADKATIREQHCTPYTDGELPFVIAIDTFRWPIRHTQRAHTQNAVAPSLKESST